MARVDHQGDMSFSYPVKIMDDIGGVAPSKVGYRHTDLLIVVIEVYANILFQLLAPAQRSINRVFIQNPAMKQAVLWDLD